MSASSGDWPAARRSRSVTAAATARNFSPASASWLPSASPADSAANASAASRILVASADVRGCSRVKTGTVALPDGERLRELREEYRKRRRPLVDPYPWMRKRLAEAG
jgi:hypothetical protein